MDLNSGFSFDDKTFSLARILNCNLDELQVEDASFACADWAYADKELVTPAGSYIVLSADEIQDALLRVLDLAIERPDAHLLFWQWFIEDSELDTSKAFNYFETELRDSIRTFCYTASSEELRKRCLTINLIKETDVVSVDAMIDKLIDAEMADLAFRYNNYAVAYLHEAGELSIASAFEKNEININKQDVVKKMYELGKDSKWVEFLSPYDVYIHTGEYLAYLVDMA